jgi:hypothetical protein
MYKIKYYILYINLCMYLYMGNKLLPPSLIKKENNK